MQDDEHLLLFTLDNSKFAITLSKIERVIPSVEITPLPDAPKIILGVIKVRKQIIPVADIRGRFNLPQREISLSDQIIIARTTKRYIGLLVDDVLDVIEFGNRQIVATKEILPPLKYVEGILQLDDGLVILHDLDKFLSLEEEQSVEAALSREKII